MNRTHLFVGLTAAAVVVLLVVVVNLGLQDGQTGGKLELAQLPGISISVIQPPTGDGVTDADCFPFSTTCYATTQGGNLLRTNQGVVTMTNPISSSPLRAAAELGGSGTVLAGGDNTSLFLCINNGSTCTPKSLPTSGTITDIAGPSATTAYVTVSDGSQSTVYMTTDAGNSFTTKVSIAGDLRAIGCFNDTNCVAAGTDTDGTTDLGVKFDASGYVLLPKFGEPLRSFVVPGEFAHTPSSKIIENLAKFGGNGWNQLQDLASQGTTATFDLDCGPFCMSLTQNASNPAVLLLSDDGWTSYTSQTLNSPVACRAGDINSQGNVLIGCDDGRFFSSPYCGNGLLEGNEQCDDGNNVSGDGCTSACTIEQVSGCTSDTQCPQGQICQNNQCQSGCRDDFQCPVGELCNQSTNECQPGGPGPECTASNPSCTAVTLEAQECPFAPHLVCDNFFGLSGSYGSCAQNQNGTATILCSNSQMTEQLCAATLQSGFIATADFSSNTQCGGGPPDLCPNVAGKDEYNGCPVADRQQVDLHVIDMKKRGDCGGAGSCKSGLANAMVKVFDRNQLNTLTITLRTGGTKQLTKNPAGDLYDDIFEAGEAAIAQVGSCTTDATGSCLAGEEGTGDYLVIVKVLETETQRTVYTGLPKSPSDFIDTDGNGTLDLASKEFQVIKVIRKDGGIEFKGGSKTVVTGSMLTMVYPESTVWEGTNQIYPFIFTSDSNWTVDVCLEAPIGYQIIGVYDANGDLVATTNCTQAFVTGETKVIAFDVLEIGSPQPHMKAKIKLRDPKGKPHSVDVSIPGYFARGFGQRGR